MKKLMKNIPTLTLTLGTMLASANALAHHYKVDGIYKMNVKIGERNFVDLVTLKEETGHKLSGTVTLPGNFTAPLTGFYGAGQSFTLNADDQIQFTIEAIERGEKLRVLYTGTIDQRSGSDGIYFQGEAFDLDNPGSPFGILNAVPLKEVPLDTTEFGFSEL
jgi:hypothetical protein